MIEIQGSVEIYRPVGKVFGFVSELGNAPKWQRGVIESKQVSEGPMQTGTQFRENVRMMGMRFDAVCEVVTVDPPRMFGMTADGRLIRYEGEFTFESLSEGESTRLSVSAWIKMKAVWRVLEWMAAREIRKESLAELAAIKRVLESEP